MGKNIKSYATTQVHFPREREGSLTAKGSKSLVYNMVQLNRTYYSLFKLQAKFSKLSSPGKIPANYANSAQFAPTVREFRKIRTFYIMFQMPAPAENPAKFQRITQIPRSLPTQSANHAKFAHFVNIFYSYFRHLQRQRMLRNSSELRKFRAVHPHSLRIARNSHHLLTLHLTFQMPGQWQRTP